MSRAVLYSLEHLLQVQSPGFKKHRYFNKLETLLFKSKALGSVRLNSRSYRLINEPRLELRYLENFYTTYRVPKNEFFTVFLSMKWELVKKKATARSEREAYISLKISSFPRDFLALYTLLLSLEGKLYPRTKKRVNEMSAYSLEQWLLYFTEILSALMSMHPVIKKIEIDTLLACMLLECLPDFHSGKLPSKITIKSQFRKLSKEHHPDSGGDVRRFLLLEKAYYTLNT